MFGDNGGILDNAGKSAYLPVYFILVIFTHARKRAG